MLAGMSSRQFEEWATLYSQEPWGDWRADLRAGIVASTLANIHRKPKAPAFTPQDFMPFAPKQAIQGDEIERKIEAFMSRYPKPKSA